MNKDSLKIFVVDDDQFVRRGFEMLFKSAGLECKSFGSGEEFMAIIPEENNDVILLDMHMPGMNGCDLLDRLPKKKIFLPVIIITAYDEQSSRECAKKYGALAYLRKPVDSEALIDIVKYNLKRVNENSATQ
jgi:two-component system, NtrC family, nitrogen regulation response regulator GlnG